MFVGLPIAAKRPSGPRSQLVLRWVAAGRRLACVALKCTPPAMGLSGWVLWTSSGQMTRPTMHLVATAPPLPGGMGGPHSCHRRPSTPVYGVMPLSHSPSNVVHRSQMSLGRVHPSTSSKNARPAAVYKSCDLPSNGMRRPHLRRLYWTPLPPIAASSSR